MNWHALLKRAFPLLAAGLFLLPALPARADSRSYYVSSYRSDITVTKNGDARVQDTITYSFSGTFHGVYVDIDASGSRGIEGMQIAVLQNGAAEPVTPSSTEADRTYTATQNGDVTEYKVYQPAENESKTFRFTYTLRGVVTDYADAAQFQRYVIGKTWQCSLQNVSVTLHLPVGADKSQLKIYGHGPLTGSSKIVDGSTVTFTAPDIPSSASDPNDSFLHVRVLFPASLTPGAAQSSSSIVSRAVSEETALANTANSRREQARQEVAAENRRETAGNVAAGVLLALWLALLILIYRKYDREFKAKFNNKYYRELPGDYSPAVASLLVNRRLESRDILATLLDLVRRRHLTLEKVTHEKKGLFRTSKEEDYKISLADSFGHEHLRQHEGELVNWLVGKIGDGKSLLLSDIEEYAKTRGNAVQFTEDYARWKEHARTEFEKQEFYDDSIGSGKALAVVLGVLFAGAGFLLLLGLSAPFAAALIPAGVVMAVYGAAFTRRSRYGDEQYAMWKAFKRFLNDFSQIRNAGITSVVIWEHYLVYAVSLGVARNVIQYLPEVAAAQPSGDFGTGMMYGMLYYQLGGMGGFEGAFDRCMTSVDAAVISARNIAASSNSSGFGGGGGFSGGGGGFSGGGGGGGGGGGAF